VTVATKAELFKYYSERSGPKRGKESPKEKRRAPSYTRVAQRAVYELESTTARPSRKSTRKSANRQKLDGQLKGEQLRRVSSSKERAARAKVKR
jgi:hypothetical protein